MSAIPYTEEVKRKLVHLSSLWMPVAILLFPQDVMAWIFGGCLVGSLLVERLRSSRVKWLTPLYDALFGRMLRAEPRPGQWIISGGPYVFAAALAVVLLVPAQVAAASMAVMLCGDTAAALIGRKFGRHPAANGQSLEGCIAFCLAGYVGAMLFTGGDYALFLIPGVLGGMLVELYEKQLRVDDNFSIPVTAALLWKLCAGIWG